MNFTSNKPGVLTVIAPHKHDNKIIKRLSSSNPVIRGTCSLTNNSVIYQNKNFTFTRNFKKASYDKIITLDSSCSFVACTTKMLTLLEISTAALKSPKLETTHVICKPHIAKKKRAHDHFYVFIEVPDMARCHLMCAGLKLCVMEHFTGQKQLCYLFPVSCLEEDKPLPPLFLSTESKS